MGRAAQPIIDVVGPFPASLPVAADSLDFVFTACDAMNFDSFVFSGPTLLLVKSTGAYTFTIESVVDEKGRTGDITTYSLANGEYARFWFGLPSQAGWRQSTGLVHIKGSNAGISFAVIRMPG
jgi:hypothetical protein